MGAPTGILGGPTRAVLEYGTGRLGDVAFTADGSSTPTNWTWDAATATYRYSDGAAALEYRNVTVAAGVGLRLAGCPLKVSGKLTLLQSGGQTGYLTASGFTATGTAGGATVTRVASAWLGGGTAGAGGVTAPANGGASTAIASGAFGGRGGTGGTVSSGTPRTGGAGGAITAWDQSVGPVFEALLWHPYQGRSSVTPAGGTGGGSGGSGGTGSGVSPGAGGGGGVLIVAARRIVHGPASQLWPWWQGHLRADGGMGSSTPSGVGTGSLCGGAGGGAAGGVILLADSIVATDGSAPLRVTAYGGDGGAAYAGSATSVAVSGGGGGGGGQVWIAYSEGIAPIGYVTGGAGGAGGSAAGGGAAGATGADGAAYVLSMTGR